MDNNPHDTFNSYGTLVTVASLMLMVVYATDAYDGWDALISILGVWFGGFYLIKKAFFDKASKFLGALIASCGAGIFYKSVISVWHFYYSGVEDIKCEACRCPTVAGGIDPLLIYILVLAILLSIIAGKPKNA